MIYISASEFAGRAGICERVARRALSKGAWRGHRLPVIEAAGQRGGAGRTVLHLLSERASPALRALLKLPEILPSTPAELGDEGPLKPAFNERHIAIAGDRMQLLAPILATERGSTERAAAIRAVGAQSHMIGGKLRRVPSRTLCSWVCATEQKPADLIPSRRSDRGQARVLVTRAWDDGIDPPKPAMAGIAKRLVRDARSMAANDGTSSREILRICSLRLQKFSVEAGSELPGRTLKAICRLVL